MPPPCMTSQISRSEKGTITEVAFERSLPKMHALCVVLYAGNIPTFKVTFFASEDQAFMAKLFVLLEIRDSCRFVTAKISGIPHSLMRTLCVYF